jgi:hypothetical protein
MEETKSVFGQAGCHIENVGELLQEFDLRFVGEDGKVIKISGDEALQLVRMLWLKLQETFEECEGKTIEIEFGNSGTANLLEIVLKTILGTGGILSADEDPIA